MYPVIGVCFLRDFCTHNTVHDFQDRVLWPNFTSWYQIPVAQLPDVLHATVKGAGATGRTRRDAAVHENIPESARCHRKFPVGAILSAIAVRVASIHSNAPSSNSCNCNAIWCKRAKISTNNGWPAWWAESRMWWETKVARWRTEQELID